MNHKQDPIGVFDSGVGGISVLRKLRQFLPNEQFLYFGDSANAPYGTRPTQQIRDLTMAAAERLMEQNVKALVVACNTATSAAIRDLRQRWPDAIIVGIEPALKPAVDRFPKGVIGVMATPATLRESKFASLMERHAAHCRVLKLPAPGLVELVEAGLADSPQADDLLRPILEPWKSDLDALVLGCTHYPFAEASIRRILGPQALLLDGGEGTARETLRRLREADLLSGGPGGITFENSLPDPALEERARVLLTL